MTRATEHSAPRRILVLQSGGFDHFLAAARAAATRHPSAELIGLVSETDLERARLAGGFVRLHAWASGSSMPVQAASGRPPADLCMVPFEDRFGIRYWNMRRLPIRYRIPMVLSYNREGRIREAGRAAWIAESVVACLGLRAAQVGYGHARRIWAWIRRRLDVTGLFVLVLAAHLVQRVRTVRPVPDAGLDGPRRLVLFIPSLGLGGAQRQLASYLRHLDRRRWEPEVITLDTVDKFFEPEIRALNVPLTLLSPHCRFQHLGVTRQLVKRLRAQPCHVLHSWLHYAVAIGAIAGALAGVPRIVGSVRSERPSRFPWFYPKWQRAIDLLTAPLQQCVIANSNAVREEYRRWAAAPDRKLTTIYNGIDAELIALRGAGELEALRADLRLPSGSPVVGIVGRLFPEKDHATFLRAAAAVHRSRPDARFLIVGEGSLLEWIEGEIARLGLSGVVRTLGGRKDALALIQLCDVLALTSTTEGFPNVLLEACMAGTPVVTTAAGGAAEVVLDGESGFVVPCRDAEAVAGRILTLLTDPGLRRHFASAARDRMERKFAADQAASAIQATYGRPDSANVPAPAPEVSCSLRGK
jgi:glycosyltransferase involved in cell wall biosynthesis